MKLVGSKRGTGLIDVMLTLFLLGLAGVIFASVFPTCFKANGQAQEYKIAAAITQKKMEQLRSLKYESLTAPCMMSASVIDSTPASSPYSFTGVDGLGNLIPQGTGTLTIQDQTADTKLVTITISWKAQSGATRSTQTQTLIADKRARKVN